MIKNYVLDTNVLIHSDGQALLAFEDNKIWISQIVMEELDSLKGRNEDNPDAAYGARKSLKMLEDLQEQSGGNLYKGIKTPDGGEITIFTLSDEDLDVNAMPSGWDKKKMDNLLIMSARALMKKRKKNVVLISNDTNVRLKAPAVGVNVESYKNDRIDPDKLYTGRYLVRLKDDIFDLFAAEKQIPIVANDTVDGHEFTENEFVLASNSVGGTIPAQYQNGALHVLRHQNEGMYDIKPRNLGQRFLKEALLSDCPLIVVNGPAGTGKTLLALAAGLELAHNQSEFDQVLLARANIMMGGKDEQIGFLPGTENEKIAPLFRSAEDAIHKMFPNQDPKRIMEEYRDRQLLDIQAIGYLRGRSIENTFIILDEAQNCTPIELKSIITRLSTGKTPSRIIVCGDPDQIDNPRLDKRNNGLVYTIDRMKGSKLCSVVTFTDDECVRSELAKEASKRM